MRGRPSPALEVDGATVLLTGASGGIGAAIARELAAGGAELTLTGRNEDALRSLAESIGSKASVIAAELASEHENAALAERAGAIDVLVANAGLGSLGGLLAAPPGRIRAFAAVNLVSVAQLASALAPGMVERGRGQIVLISSMAGKL